MFSKGGWLHIFLNMCDWLKVMFFICDWLQIFLNMCDWFTVMFFICDWLQIMCFTAFSVVSMVTAVVSIQLLRLGLVNHTTDGQTFQKQDKDTLIIIALVLAGSEILVCLLSTLLSCRMAKVAKEELCKRREGMFHVKVVGHKDIVVVTSPLTDKCGDNNKAEDDTEL